MNYLGLTLFISVIAFACFLILGASLTDATIWCIMCFVYGRATTAITMITGKAENPKSPLYGAMYFGVFIAFMLLMHFLALDGSMNLWVIAFLVGLLMSQFLALCLFGLRSENNSS